MEKDTSYIVRVPESLKRAFIDAAKSQDMDGAKLIRAYMRSYAEKHAQGDLLEPTKPSSRKKAG